MTTLVRSGTQDDLPLIAKHYGRGDTPWDPFGDVAKLREIPLGGFIVAEVDGEYAGFLYWFESERPWFDEGVGRCAQIEEVQVLPRHRGKGVGRKLLVAAMDQLGGLPLDAAYVETTEENDVARHLYETEGFQPLLRTVLYRMTLKENGTDR